MHSPLFLKRILICFSLLLSACSVTQPLAYQSERTIEKRDQYNGIKGMIQQQKDQVYLIDKQVVSRKISKKIDAAVMYHKEISKK